MHKRDIIVIGMSLGGVGGLRTIVRDSPKDLAAAIIRGLAYIAVSARGLLPHILDKESALPAATAFDGEKYLNSRVCAAPPDRRPADRKRALTNRKKIPSVRRSNRFFVRRRRRHTAAA